MVGRYMINWFTRDIDLPREQLAGKGLRILLMNVSTSQEEQWITCVLVHSST
jgi:hypothetical protein